MIKKPTTYVASSLASTVTNAGYALAMRYQNSPVSNVSMSLATPIDAESDDGLTMDRREEIRAEFTKANATPSEASAEEFDIITTNVATGLQRMLQTVRNVVVPACKTAKEYYDNCNMESNVPEIEVTPVVFHAVHQASEITEHLVNSYGDYRPMDEYRSFLMAMPSQDTLIEWLSDNNHFTAEQTKAWIASFDFEVTSNDVWHSMFGETRAITPTGLNFTTRGRLPFNFDHLLLAYLLTAYLGDNPQDIDAESVTLEEWERSMHLLHCLMGSHLLQAYMWRVRCQKQNRVVFRYENKINGDAIRVWVNQDTYPEYLAQGGAPQVILGACVTKPTLVTKSDLDSEAEALQTAWKRHHHIVRQTHLDRRMSERRNVLRSVVMDRTSVNKDLPEIETDELVRRVGSEIAAIREADLDDAWRTITNLICDVYYPSTPYKEFLAAMDRVSAADPDMPARELATIATVEMLAQWLAKQLTATPFTVESEAIAEG